MAGDLPSRVFDQRLHAEGLRSRNRGVERVALLATLYLAIAIVEALVSDGAILDCWRVLGPLLAGGPASAEATRSAWAALDGFWARAWQLSLLCLALPIIVAVVSRRFGWLRRPTGSSLRHRVAHEHALNVDIDGGPAWSLLWWGAAAWTLLATSYPAIAGAVRAAGASAAGLEGFGIHWLQVLLGRFLALSLGFAVLEALRVRYRRRSLLARLELEDQARGA